MSGEIASAFVRIRPNMDGFQGEVTSGVRRAFGGVGKVVAGTLVAAGAAAGAVGAGLAISAKSAITFERSMRNVNSIAGLGEKQFQQLGKSVTGMAAEVGQKPKILADGLYDLVSSGFDAADAVKVLRTSAIAATAGLTSAEVSAGAVAAALNAYHLEADQSRKVSDILFQTVNKGVLTFEELAQNMGDLVPAAAPLGITLEEVGASMATITLQGVPAAEAATRVKNAMLQIATPSKGLTKLLKQNGYESGAAAIRARGFSGVLDMMSKATGGNVDQLAELLPEMRGLLGVVGLTGKNVKTYTDNLRAMDDASKGAGVTSAVFAEQSKSLAVQWQKTSAQIEVFKVKIGSVLLPALSTALDHVNRLFSRLEGATGFRAKLDIVWEGVREAGETLASKLREAVAAVDWAAVWSGATGVASGLADTVSTQLDAIDWSAVGNKIVAGIAASVRAGGELTVAVSQMLQEAIGRVDVAASTGNLGEVFVKGILQSFVTILDPMFWIRNWRLMADVAFAALTLAFLPAKFVKAIPLIGPILSVIRNATRTVVAAFGRLGREMLEGLGDVLAPGIGGVVARVIAALRALPGRVRQIILDTARLAGQAAGFLVRDVIRAISALPRLAWAALERLAPQVATAIRMAIASAVKTAAEWLSAGVLLAGRLVKAILDKLGDLLPGLTGKLLSAIAVVRAAAEGFVSAAASIGAAIVRGVLSGLGGLFSSVAGAIKSKVGGAISWVRDNLGSTAEEHAAKEIGKPVAAGVVWGFLVGIRELPQKMKDSVRNALQKVRETVQARQGVVSNSFSRLGTYATRAFEAATDAHLDKMARRFETKIKRTITEPMNKALDALERRRDKAMEALDVRQDKETPEEKALREFREGREAADLAARRADLERRAAELSAPARVERSEGDTDAEFATRVAEAERERLEELAQIRAEQAEMDLDARERELERLAQQSREAADKEIEEERRRAEERFERERERIEERFRLREAEATRLYDQQVRNYQSERDLQAQHLGDMLESLQNRLALHPEEWKSVNKRIQGLFRTAFGPQYKTAGRNLGTGFAKGIREAFSEVEAAAKDLASILAKYLPHSPAEKGPLSVLPDWGAYLTAGLRPGMVAAAMASALAAPGLGLSGAAGAAAPPQIVGALQPLGTLVSQNAAMLEELREQTALARDGRTVVVPVPGAPSAPAPDSIAQEVRR